MHNDIIFLYLYLYQINLTNVDVTYFFVIYRSHNKRTCIIYTVYGCDRNCKTI